MMIKDKFFLFLIENVCCDPYLNRLVETIQMMGHSICFYAEVTKIILVITKYSHLSRALSNPLSYFFGYKTEFFPSKTIPKI